MAAGVEGVSVKLGSASRTEDVTQQPQPDSAQGRSIDLQWAAFEETSLTSHANEHPGRATLQVSRDIAGTLMTKHGAETLHCLHLEGSTALLMNGNSAVLSSEAWRSIVYCRVGCTVKLLPNAGELLQTMDDVRLAAASRIRLDATFPALARMVRNAGSHQQYGAACTSVMACKSVCRMAACSWRLVDLQVQHVNLGLVSC